MAPARCLPTVAGLPTKPVPFLSPALLSLDSRDRSQTYQPVRLRRLKQHLCPVPSAWSPPQSPFSSRDPPAVPQLTGPSIARQERGLASPTQVRAASRTRTGSEQVQPGAHLTFPRHKHGAKAPAKRRDGDGCKRGWNRLAWGGPAPRSPRRAVPAPGGSARMASLASHRALQPDRGAPSRPSSPCPPGAQGWQKGAVFNHSAEVPAPLGLAARAPGHRGRGSSGPSRGGEAAGPARPSRNPGRGPGPGPSPRTPARAPQLGHFGAAGALPPQPGLPAHRGASGRARGAGLAEGSIAERDAGLAVWSRRGCFKQPRRRFVTAAEKRVAAIGVM